MNRLKRWLLWGAVGGVASLGLMAIAPFFLNSSYPLLGFCIWLTVVTGWFFFGITVILHWLDARKARRLFIRQCPEYHYLSWVDFLNVSSLQVQQDLKTLSIAQSDPDYHALGLSPVDFVTRYQK